MTQTHYESRGAVAVIRMDNPPVNGLGYELRVGIVESLNRAIADPAIRAIVLTGSDRAFSGGADIREFGSPRATQEPNLLTVIRAAEGSPKPVVAAISGLAMGGGLELALGCHYRVAAKGAQLALPEIKLGLIPGAGGTQRLPRLLGVEAALNMMLSGNPVAAEQFPGRAMVDEIVEGDLLEGALGFANRVAEEGRGTPRVRDMPVTHRNPEPYLQFCRNTVAAVAKGMPAPGKLIDAVAAALTKPFDEGMKVEREAFLWLLGTPESKAMRHAFMGERAASKIDDVPDGTPRRPIAKVGVIGAGTMGGGISMNFLNAGIPVTLLETRQEALERGVGTIRRNYENSVKKGKLAPEKLEGRMALLTPTLDFAALSDADLIIEAVFEDMGVKEGVFRQLDEIAKPGAILASNTSTLDVNAIAGFTRRPQDVVGLHFFSPANVMKLLEVVRGKATAPDVMATVMTMAKTIRKTAVVSGVCDGFIGNRMIEHYGRMAGFLVEEGATPWHVDKALEKWGMAMGPFRMGDLAGNDIGWAIRKRRYVEKPDVKYARIADRLCELGRFGQKTGAGWYRYETGKRDAIPDKDIEKLIVEYRMEQGITPRKVSDQEMVERCIYALVNEGARILEEGIAARASDIDMVYLTGYGFPLLRGGPMFYADQCGLYNVAATMRRFAAESGDPFWEPAPLLARLAAEGKTFN